MATTAQDIRRRRLQVERETIGRLETRLNGLQSALNDATHAYNAALAVMTELKAEVEDAKREHCAANDRLQTVQQAYQRELMAKLPGDVVRLIFQELLPLRESCNIILNEPGRFGCIIHDAAVSVLPFTLAGVCHKWREVALGLPALWSFIHIGRTGPTPSRLRRVKLQLERSRSAPLDVHIITNEGDDPEILRDIFDALHEHPWRLQHMLHVLREAPLDHLSLIQRAAPHLRRVDVRSVARAMVPGAARELRLLPLGPHLELLRLGGAQCILAPKQPYVFPALVSLTWNQPGFGYAWNIIFAARTTLKEVLLAPRSGSSDDPPFAPTVPVVVRNLEQLHVLTYSHWSVATYLPKLRAPKLTTLTLPASPPQLIMQSFLEAVAPTVTTLALVSEIQPVSLHKLSVLTKVEHLMFSRAPAMYMVPYKVADLFFADLATPPHVANGPQPWIWPRLSTIALSQAGSFEAGNGEGFLQFVRSRTGPGLDANSTPRRLTRVDLADTASPTWLRNEVGRMFA